MTRTLLQGDCRDVLKTLPAQSVHCCVTSPPYYGLRDYGVDGQIGLEQTPDEYVAELVEVFRQVRRVLQDDGTLWLNLGDSYASNGDLSEGGSEKQRSNKGANNIHRNINPGLRAKNLIGIPWRVAFALQADGWYLRQDIIWHKPNPMPESVTDRCTKAHEYIFLFTKSPRYFYDAKAIAEPSVDKESLGPRKARSKDKREGDPFFATKVGNHAEGKSYPTRNRRSVWTVATQPYSGAHFAMFPPALIEPCILAGCPAGGTVIDPFGGSGTTGMVAESLGRNSILIELNPEYIEIQKQRTAQIGMAL